MILLDIADSLAGTYDLTQSISSLTSFMIAASGIAILITLILLLILTKKYTGYHFFPIIYGITAYLIFCVLIGGLVNSFFTDLSAMSGSTTNYVILFTIALIITSTFVVLGRLITMWFLRKYYASYGDAYAIGLGFALCEGILNGITIFLNYGLCLTINEMGLTAFVNSYSTVAEAESQLTSILVFFTTPATYYLLSGIECVYVMIFQTMLSVMLYGIFNKDLGKQFIFVAIGMNVLLSLPSLFYNVGFVFSQVGAFAAETLIFAGSIIYFLRLHNSYYKDVEIPKKKRKGKNDNEPTKMPKFNSNINKL